MGEIFSESSEWMYMPGDLRFARWCDPQTIEALLQLFHKLPAGHKEPCEVTE